MKIAEVKSILAGGSHFVRITTDDGITGIGQSACWAYPEAVDAIVRSAFAPYLVGKDPRHVEHHWQHLHRMGPFRGSVLGGAISAVDIALWDIKGKQLGVPIWELLGGPCRDRVRLHLLLLGGQDPDEVAKATREGAEQGFTAIKFDPLRPGYADASLSRLIDSAVEVVAAAREAVGRDVDLILELHRKLTPLQALPLAEALAAFDPLFIEDPIQIDSIVSQAEFCRRIRSPLAYGERLHTIWEFRELLERSGPTFCRPDPGLAGGITHTKKIAAIAEAHHSAIVTHNFLGPVLTAASVHLDVSIPNFVVQEYSMIDERADVVQAFPGTLRREGGYLPLPQAPGLGVELDESTLGSLAPLGRDLWEIPLRSDGSVAFSV